MLVLALPILVLIVVGDNVAVSKEASYKSEEKAGSLGGESSSLWKPAGLSFLPPGGLGPVGSQPVSQSPHHTWGTWQGSQAPLTLSFCCWKDRLQRHLLPGCHKVPPLLISQD